MKKFIDLAYHIIAMENDSYLAGHPEWNEFVTEAKKAILSNIDAIQKVLLKDNQDMYDMGMITTQEYYDKRTEIHNQ